MIKCFTWMLLLMFTILTSCHPDLFSHRQYRTGFYRESISNKSSTNKFDVTDNINKSSFKIEKEQADAKESIMQNGLISSAVINSIKDSIIITRKKGEKQIKQYFKDSKNYDIIVIKRNGYEDIVNERKSARLNLVAMYKAVVLIALIISIIPIFGLIATSKAKNNRKDLLEYGEEQVVNENRKRLTIATIISSTITILFALIVLFLLLAIVSSPILFI